MKKEDEIEKKNDYFKFLLFHVTMIFTAEFTCS